MTMQRFLTGGMQDLGPREVGVVASTDQLARDGHILEPRGISLDNYRRNPIVLWTHDITQPVGAATAVAVEGRSLAARIEFAPAGASAVADEICSLVKSGVIKGVSVGFDPIDVEPIDPKMGSRGGLHITTSELLEISFCAIPSTPRLWGCSTWAQGRTRRRSACCDALPSAQVPLPSSGPWARSAATVPIRCHGA